MQAERASCSSTAERRAAVLRLNMAWRCGRCAGGPGAFAALGGEAGVGPERPEAGAPSPTLVSSKQGRARGYT